MNDLNCNYTLAPPADAVTETRFQVAVVTAAAGQHLHIAPAHAPHYTEDTVQ